MLTSYIVAVAIATPLTGWLSQRPGVKHLKAAAVAGFTIASVLYGIAGTLAQIIGARLLQGLFGAALVPLSRSILLDVNPRKKQGQAMAVWGMDVMVGPDPRASARGLANRQLQLALGVLHQRAEAQ